MPQLLLPILSSEITYINGRVTVYQHEGDWTYFLGEYPIYSHRADDHCMFRLTIAQLIESGSCRQLEIIKAFSVSKSSVIRAQSGSKQTEKIWISRLLSKQARSKKKRHDINTGSS